MSSSPITRRAGLVMASLILIVANTIANAQDNSYKASFEQNKESVAVNVLVGQSRVINFDRPVGRFSVSNPEIAEAILVTPDQVLVNGKAFGQVNFIAWEQSGREFLVFDVYVRANLSLIDSQIRALFPKDDIRLSQANGSVVISGSVGSDGVSKQVQSVVEAAGFKSVNMLSTPTKSATQVLLQVRVAEVSKNRMKDLGTSFAYQGSPGAGGYVNSGSGPSGVANVTNGILGGNLTPALNLLVMGGNTLATLRMLQTQGAVRGLAEPNIIAMDGQEASFLAGGEFPIPVVQTDGARTGVSVVFKEYGVRLTFKPTVIDEDHIRLELNPEVSTIDYSTGVKFDGFLIPGLSTRRAKTGVELRDGQSFALAGLLDNRETKSISEVPFLSQIPVIGNLFKSKSFQKNESELMFIVTAQIVKPVNGDDLPTMRGIDGLKNGSPLGVEPHGEGIQGQSGYKISGQGGEAPKTTTEPAKSTETKTKTASESGSTSSGSGVVSETRDPHTPLPVATNVRKLFIPDSIKP